MAVGSSKSKDNGNEEQLDINGNNEEEHQKKMEKLMSKASIKGDIAAQEEVESKFKMELAMADLTRKVKGR